MKKKGFTLIELIVVIAIIALLIGILVPSVNGIKRQAKSLGQAAQIREIDTALEIWAHDNDMEYPDSDFTGTAGGTFGSHVLTEALVGRDLHGFDDDSTWNAGDDASGTPYTSMANRNYSYLELNTIDVAQMGQVSPLLTTGIYLGDDDGSGTPIAGNAPAYVFTDLFRKKKITTNAGVTRKIGTPILYYKASKSSSLWEHPPGTGTQVFNYLDNDEMMNFGHIITGEIHPLYNDAGLFHDKFINPQYPVNGGNYVPYNRDTFILISAGADGLFGTKDDITNTPD